MKTFSVGQLRGLRQALATHSWGKDVELFLLKVPISTPEGGLLDIGCTVRMIERVSNNAVQVQTIYECGNGKKKTLCQVLEIWKLKSKDRSLWTVQDIFDFVLDGKEALGVGQGHNHSEYHRRPTTLIIHSWEARFISLIDSITEWFVETDLVALSLFDGKQWCENFNLKQAALEIWCFDRAALYVENWQAREPLKTAQCVWELVESFRAGIPLRLFLPLVQVDNLLSELRDGYNKCMTNFGMVLPFNRTNVGDNSDIMNDLNSQSSAERAEVAYYLRKTIHGLLVELVEKEEKKGIFKTDLGSSGEEISVSVDRAELGHLLNDLGGVYTYMGFLQEALEAFRKSFVVFQSVQERRSMTGSLQNIGLTLGSLGRFQEGLAFLQGALVGVEHSVPREKLWYAGILNDMGRAYCNLAQFDQAMVCFQQAAVAFEAMMHPSRSSVYHNMGNTFFEQNMLEKAMEKYNQSLEVAAQSEPIVEKCVKDRPETISTLQGIALVQLEQGELDTATATLEKVLKLEESVFGSYHPRLVRTKHLLATTLYRKGMFEKALQKCEQNIADLSIPGPSEKVQFANIYSLQGSCFGELERFSEAHISFTKALDFQVQVFGAQHLTVMSTLNSIAYLLCRSGKVSQAEGVLREANSICVQFSNPSIEQGFLFFTTAYLKLAKYDLTGAEFHARRALATLSTVQPSMMHPLHAQTLALLGKILLEQEDFHRAKEFLFQALEMILLKVRHSQPKHDSGPDMQPMSVSNYSPSTYQAMSLVPGSVELGGIFHALGNLFAMKGNREESREWYAKAMDAFLHQLPENSDSVQRLIHDMVVRGCGKDFDCDSANSQRSHSPVPSEVFVDTDDEMQYIEVDSEHVDALDSDIVDDALDSDIADECDSVVDRVEVNHSTCLQMCMENHSEWEKEQSLESPVHEHLNRHCKDLYYVEKSNVGCTSVIPASETDSKSITSVIPASETDSKSTTSVIPTNKTDSKSTTSPPPPKLDSISVPPCSQPLPSAPAPVLRDEVSIPMPPYDLHLLVEPGIAYLVNLV